MTPPCTLFASCDETFKPDELIRQVLRVDTLPDGDLIVEDIKSYNWHIETKYYTADIKLCSTQTRTIGTSQFAESLQAIVIYFDPAKKESFELVKAWLPYLAEIEPSIQLLVCKCCNDDHEIDKVSLQHWCIDNAFELVEMDSEDDDEEDDFAETTGVQRIIQALHAHTWSNLVMKDKPDIVSPYMRKLMEEQQTENMLNKSKEHIPDSGSNDSASEHIPKINPTTASNDSLTAEGKEHNKSSVSSDKHTVKCAKDTSSNVSENSSTEKKAGSDTKPTTEEGLESLLQMDDLAMMQAVCSEEGEEESFEQLFSKFRLMKEKADSLPPEQRKKYAEHVALSFWKAMGGDEDEIDGLSDTSDG